MILKDLKVVFQLLGKVFHVKYAFELLRITSHANKYLLNNCIKQNHYREADF